MTRFVLLSLFIAFTTQLAAAPQAVAPLGEQIPWLLGHPIWGTHKKMTEKDEQQLREFMRLKHHSHGLKNQHLG